MSTLLCEGHVVSTLGIRLHFFDGTARDPALVPQSQAQFTPRHMQMRQFGVDTLGIFGDLNLKLELIRRNGSEFENPSDAVTGLEYTYAGLLSPLQDNDIVSADWCSSENFNFLRLLLCNDRMDLGVVFEYLWDERGEEATQIFQNDVLAGL